MQNQSIIVHNVTSIRLTGRADKLESGTFYRTLEVTDEHGNVFRFTMLAEDKENLTLK